MEFIKKNTEQINNDKAIKLAKEFDLHEDVVKLLFLRGIDTKEAIELALQMPKAKFDETVEVHIKLGVDSKQADQQVRGVLVLPNGTGKSKKVLVLAKGEKAAQAKEAGADFVGDDDMIEKIQKEHKTVERIKISVTAKVRLFTTE